MILRTPNEPNYSHLEMNFSEKHRLFYITIYECSYVNEIEVSILLDFLFSKYGILNAIVITWNKEFKVFNYLPFNKKLQRKVKFDLDDLFPDKLRNIYQHELRVSVFEELSVDKNYVAELMWNEFVLQMNATIMKIPNNKDNISFGFPNDEGNDGTGAVGQLIRHDVDIALNRQFYESYILDDHLAEMTYPVGRDDICILVPNLLTTLVDNSNTELIAGILGLYILIMFVLLTIVYHWIDHFEHNRKQRRPLKSVWFYFVQWSFNSGTTKFPSSLPQRIILAFWLFYMILNNTIYSSETFRGYVVNVREDRIDNIAELDATNLKIQTTENISDRILKYYENSTRYYNFLNNLVDVAAHQYATLITDTETNVPMIFSAEKSLLNHFLHYNPNYYVMDECPVPSLETIFVSYGSPYLEHIDSLVFYIIEAGLWDLWKSRFYRKPIRNVQRRIPSIELQKTLIQVLVCGYTVALVIFFIEFIVFYWRYVRLIIRNIKKKIRLTK